MSANGEHLHTALETQVEQIAGRLTVLEANHKTLRDAHMADIVELDGRLDILESAPDPDPENPSPPDPDPPPPEEPTGIVLVDGDAPAQIDAHPGASFLLSGVYRNFNMIRPQPGQSIVGVPEGAELVGNGSWPTAIIGGTKSNRHPGPVLLDNFAVTGYQTRFTDELAAIAGYWSEDWEYRRLHVHHNTGNGEGIRFGERAKVIYCIVADNSGMGLGGHGDDWLVQENEIARNRGKDAGHTGGVKVVYSRNGRFYKNHVHHNVGTGLWDDIDNWAVVHEENLVEHNTERGIATEIGFETVIRGNVVRYNGKAFDTWLWGAQILVQNSARVLVEGNVMTVGADGGDGLSVIEQRRGNSTRYPEVWLARGFKLRDNDLTFEGVGGQVGVVSDQGTNAELRASGECMGLRIKAPQGWWDRNNFEAAARLSLEAFIQRTGWQVEVA